MIIDGTVQVCPTSDITTHDTVFQATPETG